MAFVWGSVSFAVVPGDSTDAIGAASDSPGPELGRRVTLFVDIDIDSITLLNDGRRAAVLQTSLQIEGTRTEPHLYVDLNRGPAFYQQAFYQQAINVIAIEMGHASPGSLVNSPLASNMFRTQALDLGRTTLRNVDLIDRSTGQGMILDAWRQLAPTLARRLRSDANVAYTSKLLTEMGLRLPPHFLSMFSRAVPYATQLRLMSPEPVPNMYLLEAPAGSSLGASVPATRYDILNPERPISAPERLQISIPDVLGSHPVSGPSLPPLEGARAQNLQLLLDECATRRRRDLERRCERSVKSNAVVTARSKGVLSTVSLGVQGAAKAAGIAGLVAAPVFIILDLVHGNWAGAAFGAAGLALGVAATMAVAGPVGWVLGGLISALFAILPGLFKAKKKPPPLEDRTQILQWTFFGDRDHTGNEECHKRGDPNCVALYGAGVLSSLFKWNNFDAIAFLLEYNKGYAMTLPEIAAAFHVVFPPGSADGEEDIATIDCVGEEFSDDTTLSLDDPKGWTCGKPRFSLKRDRITISGVNQTGDQVIDRIIPKPGGDCRLVNDAANALHLPELNVTISGQPVAIACNLSSTQDISGTVVALADNRTNSAFANTSIPLFVSSGNASSDGKNGHFLTAPPLNGFVSLNATDTVCLGTETSILCLPNGTYDRQEGHVGFESRGVINLTMPLNASTLWRINGYPGGPRTPTPLIKKRYATNQTASDTGFADDMRKENGPFDIIVPGDAPSAVCLFAKTKYKGDVVCYGPGGGEINGGMRGKAQSIAVHGSASAWIYAERYGDSGGVEVTSSIEDLTGQIYGSTGNFNQKIVAMWVRVS
ncbi:MAG: hypothetical protein M1817_004523 [Caeruleum heppii]|nr:MAG: hypothetical protein M1817_004523 [Caeruleum heppii]